MHNEVGQLKIQLIKMMNIRKLVFHQDTFYFNKAIERNAMGELRNTEPCLGGLMVRKKKQHTLRADTYALTIAAYVNIE